MDKLNIDKFKKTRQIVFWDDNENKEYKRIFKKENILYSSQRIIHWKHNLAQVLAISNDCRVVYDYNPNGIDCFVFGSPEEIEHIKQTFEKISKSIDNICLNYMDENKERMDENKERGKTFTNSFKHGALSYIVNNLFLENNSENDNYKKIKLEGKRINSNAYSNGATSMGNHLGN